MGLAKGFSWLVFGSLASLSAAVTSWDLCWLPGQQKVTTPIQDKVQHISSCPCETTVTSLYAKLSEQPFFKFNSRRVHALILSSLLNITPQNCGCLTLEQFYLPRLWHSISVLNNDCFKLSGASRHTQLVPLHTGNNDLITVKGQYFLQTADFTSLSLNQTFSRTSVLMSSLCESHTEGRHPCQRAQCPLWQTLIIIRVSECTITNSLRAQTPTATPARYLEKPGQWPYLIHKATCRQA